MSSGPENYVGARLGLVLGPGFLATEPAYLQRLSDGLRAALKADGREPSEIAENAVVAGVTPSQLRATFAQWSRAQAKAVATVRDLAKVRFNAVVSLCPDQAFEQALTTAQSRGAVRREVTVLVDPTHVARHYALTVYKPLGSIETDNLALTQSEVAQRTARWNAHVGDFVTTVRGGPILCLGMDSVEPALLRTLFSALFFGTKTRPGRVLLSETESHTAKQLLTHIVPTSSLVLIPGQPLEVARALQPRASARQTTLQFAVQSGASVTIDLASFGDVFATLPSTPTLKAEDREELLELLFTPDVPNWDPFLWNLDLERTATAEVLAAVSGKDAVAVHMHGRAASGKTTILKRVARELAASGRQVLWLRQYPHDDLHERLRACFKAMADIERDQRALVIIVDDLSSSTVRLHELRSQALAAGITLHLITASRTSAQQHQEWGTDAQVIEVPDTLDHDEWGRLPRYLIQLGVADAEEQAANALRGVPRGTRDTLAVLYFLLPGTRRRIKDSVLNEYFALGQLRSIRDGIKRMLGTCAPKSRGAGLGPVLRG